jgi:hypothetical protein
MKQVIELLDEAIKKIFPILDECSNSNKYSKHNKIELMTAASDMINAITVLKSLSTIDNITNLKS